MCHVSRVRCHMPHYFFLIKFFLNFYSSSSDKVFGLDGGGSVINGAYPINFLIENNILRLIFSIINYFSVRKNLKSTRVPLKQYARFQIAATKLRFTKCYNYLVIIGPI